MKIHPVGAELFQMERRTDQHVDPNSYVSQFCKRIQKQAEREML